MNNGRIIRVAAAMSERFGTELAKRAAYSRVSAARWRTWGCRVRQLPTRARLRKFWYAVGAALRRGSALNAAVIDERLRLQAVTASASNGFGYADMTRLKRSARTGNYICACGRGYASRSDGLCFTCRRGPRPVFTIATYGAAT
jgi:hypothetical protein